MTYKKYTEDQLIQGIKAKDKEILSWIYQSMAEPTKKMFHQMGLGAIAKEENYQDIFQKGMEIIYRNIKLDQRTFRRPEQRILQALEELTIAHFIREDAMKNWLETKYTNQIKQLLRKIKMIGHTQSLKAIFEEVYQYLCLACQKESYRLGQLTSLIEYNIKVKTADHFLSNPQIWPWIESETKTVAINTWRFLVNNRPDVDVDLIFNQSLESVWNNVREGKYATGSNVFEYLKSTYKRRLISELRKKRREVSVEDDAAPQVQEVTYQSEPLDELEVDLVLTKEILSEALILALDELKEKPKDLIYQFQFGDKRLTDIEEQRQLKPGTAKVLNNRANKSWLNHYFQRLLSLSTGELSDECYDKLKGKSLKVKDEEIMECRQMLRQIAEERILDLLKQLRQRDPALSGEDLKSFIHYSMNNYLKNNIPISIDRLDEWKKLS